jgi:hypothetical protein
MSWYLLENKWDTNFRRIGEIVVNFKKGRADRGFSSAFFYAALKSGTGGAFLAV